MSNSWLTVCPIIQDEKKITFICWLCHAVLAVVGDSCEYYLKCP